MISAAIAEVLNRPAATGPILIAVTILLSVALVVGAVCCRSAAARHAVLLWAMLAVGLSPLAFLMTDWGGLAPVVRLPNAISLAANFERTQEVPLAIPRQTHGVTSVAITMADWLWRVWLIGSLIGLVRIAHGLAVLQRLRRTATLLDPAAARTPLSSLADLLNRPAPPLLVSEEITVPMTVGLFRPMVLLPTALAEQLCERRLLHVLVHESAHAVRRDPLIGLYQRVLAAVFWFHPLLHWCNRLLDEAREELCDNFALRAASAPEYTRTLLFIAQSVKCLPRELLVMSLFSSVQRLEKRVAGLLVPGRNTMTSVNGWKRVAIGLGFVLGGYVLTAWAAGTTKSSGHDLSQRVEFSVGAKQFKDGDSITIEEVIGTAGQFEAGNVYIIKGTYRLKSVDSAALTAYVTVDGNKVKELRVPTQRTQTMDVQRGEGRFSLIYYMWQDGWPHLSFYPHNGGSWIGTVYFGTGDTLLKRGWWEK